MTYSIHIDSAADETTLWQVGYPHTFKLSFRMSFAVRDLVEAYEKLMNETRGN